MWAQLLCAVPSVADTFFSEFHHCYIVQLFSLVSTLKHTVSYSSLLWPGDGKTFCLVPNLEQCKQIFSWCRINKDFSYHILWLLKLFILITVTHTRGVTAGSQQKPVAAVAIVHLDALCSMCSLDNVMYSVSNCGDAASCFWCVWYVVSVLAKMTYKRIIIIIVVLGHCCYTITLCWKDNLLLLKLCQSNLLVMNFFMCCHILYVPHVQYL